MQPESVEIKVSLSGPSVVADSIGKLALENGRAWTILFCEDVTRAAAETALLDIGVVLRARESPVLTVTRPSSYGRAGGPNFIRSSCRTATTAIRS